MESIPEIQRFISDMQSLSSILQRRWKPAVTTSGLMFGGIVLLIVLMGPSYEACGKLLLEKSNPSSSLTESGKEISDLNSVGSSDPVANEMEILKSLPIAERTINDLQLKDNKGKALKPQTFIKNSLKVEKVRGTDILKVTYKSKSPQEAAVVVNKLMNVYIERSILIDRSKALLTGQFVQKQLPETEFEVRKAEDSIRKFKEANLISDLDAEKQATEAAIATLNQKVSEATTALKSSLSHTKSLQNQLGFEPTTAMQVSSLSQSPSVQEAVSELQKTESQLATSRDRYGNSHPIIIDLQNKVNTLKQVLQTRVGQITNSRINLSPSQIQIRGVKQELLDDYVKQQSENVALSSQIDALYHEKLIYLRRTRVLPKLEQKQKELERQLNASQSTYSSLLTKSQEIRIAANQSDGNARIIEYAMVPELFRIKPIILKVFLGILLGAITGIGITFWLELRDKSIKTVKEAREKFEYTLLGIIPALEFPGHNLSLRDEPEYSVPQLVVQASPLSPISEAYRMLHSNLRFMSADTQLKTIVVTSSVPGEGKSTVSANLALIMVQQGLKVLLIDADMRCSMQHRIWETNQFRGLSDVIAGQAEFKDAVHHEENGLSILTAGAIPPNSGSLLESKKMALLLKQLSEEFDAVIIDTPPVLYTNDPRILGNIADGILLVTRPGVVDSDNAAAAKELLSQLEHKVLGMVVNGVLPRNEKNSYYYYQERYQLDSVDSDLNNHEIKISVNRKAS